MKLGILVLGLILVLASGASAARYDMKPGEKTNFIQFESKAPMETFTGKTSQVTGHVDLDPAKIADSIDVYIEVPLATLDTGIDLRNQHMCKNHLDTEKYPKAIFRGARVATGAGATLEPGKAKNVVVEGTFEIHGVTKPIKVPVELTLVRANGKDALRSVAKFEVKLADYEIPRPSFLVMKLDEVQRITFDVTASAAP